LSDEEPKILDPRDEVPRRGEIEGKWLRSLKMKEKETKEIKI